MLNFHFMQKKKNSDIFNTFSYKRSRFHLRRKTSHFDATRHNLSNSTRFTVNRSKIGATENTRTQVLTLDVVYHSWANIDMKVFEHFEIEWTLFQDD